MENLLSGVILDIKIPSRSCLKILVWMTNIQVSRELLGQIKNLEYSEVLPSMAFKLFRN